MIFKIYNLAGEELRQEDIDTSAVDQVKGSAALVHQMVVAALANRRSPIAHTKTRGEVRGGGKKPWRQKGTGRARHGSTRSPLWVGGGITFGPRSNRNFTKAMPLTMRRKAFAMALSEKIKSGQVVLVESLKLPELKTKHVATMLTNLPVANKNKRAKAVMVFTEADGNLTRATRNIEHAYAAQARDVDLVSLLWGKSLVTTPSALITLLQRCQIKRKTKV